MPPTDEKADITIEMTKEIKKAKRNTIKKEGPVTRIYPMDIGPQNFYPESIKFTVYKRESASMEKVWNTTVKAWKAFGDLTSERIAEPDYQFADGSTIRSQAQKDAMRASQALQNPTDNSGDMMRAGATVWNYISKQTYASEIYEAARMILSAATSGLRQPNIKDSNKHILDKVYLNMPNEISFAEPAAWEGTDLGTIGAIAKAPGMKEGVAAGALANIGNMVGGGGGYLAGLIAQHSKGILKGLGPMAGALLGTLGGNTMQRMFESSFANISNPYKEMTFTGIGFRQFGFNFVFRARNQDEVQVVQDIIKIFRYHSKPTTAHGGGILRYPNEFLIEFLIKPEKDFSPITLENNKHRKIDIEDRFETNPYVPQLKMCVCKGVNTNFSSQNTWRTLKSGAPVEISLQLQFEETELVTGEDVIGETDFGRFVGSGGTF